MSGGQHINAFLDLDERAYRLDPSDEPSLNASIAWELVNNSPLHAFHFHPRLGGERKERTKSTDAGTLAHALLLGKGMDAIEIARATEDVYSGRGKDKALRVKAGDPFPDWKLAAAREAKAAIEATGRIPMLQRDLDRIEPISDVMRTRLLDWDERALTGDKEVTAMWVARATDGTPVQCRARLDLLDGWTIRDLKAWKSAHPRYLQSALVRMGSHLQAAAYVQAVETIDPKAAGRATYKWLVCETSAPYPVTPVRFGGMMRALGERQWQQAVDLWAYCIRTGKWGRGYVDEEITIEPRPFDLEPLGQGDPDWDEHNEGESSYESANA